jgi:tRNA1(Val) A37 N6-methylase TrmN6
MRASRMSCARNKHERVAETTLEAALGGRLELRQPRRGHRFGHDAILLAAATAARPGEHAVDLGAGVGAAGLALALRVPGLRVTLVEVDADLAALAHDNAVRNRLADRALSLVLDATAPARSFAAAGCTAGSADRVLMNPPFNAPQHPSPQSARRLAHVAAKDVAAWVRSAARLLRPKGVVTLIWRADGLAQVLDALDRDFGAVAVLPVHARPDAAAVRVLVRAVKSSRAPLALLPGLLLADAAGRPTAEAEAVLREHATLSLADL